MLRMKARAHSLELLEPLHSLRCLELDVLMLTLPAPLSGYRIQTLKHENARKINVNLLHKKYEYHMRRD